MSEHSKPSNFEENVQDMILRVIGIARLLMTDGAAADDSLAESKRAGHKKYKNKNS